jgi:drug/metabolite transporter (DMT)-like permease
MAIGSTRGLLAGFFLFFCFGGLKGKFKFKEFTKVHFLAGLSMALLSLSLTVAMKYTTAANAIVLNYSAPIWVALLAPWLLREKTQGRDWFFIAIIFGGILLFFVGGLSPMGFFGNICGVISGFFFATQAICLRFIKKGSPAMAMTLGAFLTFLIGLGFWGPPWPDLRSVFYLLILGVFQLGCAYCLYSLASPYVKSLELVVVTMIEPILNPLWVFLLLGEKPGPFAILGGIIVIAGVLVWSFGKHRQREAAPGES